MGVVGVVSCYDSWRVLRLGGHFREGCFESGCDDDSTDIHLMIPNEMTAR